MEIRNFLQWLTSLNTTYPDLKLWMDYYILKQGQTAIVYRGSITTKPLTGKGFRREERDWTGEIGGNLASLMRITYYFELTTEVIYIRLLLTPPESNELTAI